MARQRRCHRHGDPAAGGLPQRAGAGARAAAARERGRGRPGGGRHDLRHRARHHPRLRFHPDRRRPGLSDPSLQPPASRTRCPVERARLVADARHRSGEHLRRLPGLPVFRRPRPGAALGVHGHRPRGGGTDHALPAAAARARQQPRCRRLGTAWPALARDRGTASAALARRRNRDCLRRLPGALAATAVGERPRCADSRTTRLARTRFRAAAANSARPMSGICSSSKARTPSPCWRRPRHLDPKLEALVARGLLDGYDHPARYLPPRAVQERRRAALARSRDAAGSARRGARHDPVQAGHLRALPGGRRTRPPASRARPCGPRRIAARGARRIAAAGATTITGRASSR